MPLMKYFGFVGSSLVILLFGMSWCFPKPVSEPVRSGIDRPVIRISSVEKLPDRVDIDTNLPTIVRPPNVMELAKSSPVIKLGEPNAGAKPTTPFPVQEIRKKQALKKRGAARNVAVHRATLAAHNQPAFIHGAQTSSSGTRLSLLELLKDRLGHGIFTAN
jgi:hypothetical protein